MISATYVCHSGDDLLVVNSARTSFKKRSQALRDGDAKLIRYLARNGHWTPFAHPQVTVHVQAPIFVARQAFKSKIGFVENEVSRRYVDDEPTFFQPKAWRGRAPNAKQGSSNVEVAMIEIEPGEAVPPALYVEDAYRTCMETYKALLAGGVAPEQARMVLPQAMMTEWFWTGSLAAWARFCRLRLDPHAQAETGEVATACAAIVEPLFPISWKALMAEGDCHEPA